MSVIIQIIFVGYFVVSFVFEIGQINYGITLSLRAYRRRAQDSEADGSLSFEMSAIIQIMIVAYFCSVICFLNRPNYGAFLSLRAYMRRAQDSEVRVVRLF